MRDESADLVVRLVSNKNFVASHRDSSEVKIVYTHKVSKPGWWNDDITKFYLGEYSSTKLEEFALIYQGDYGVLSESEKLFYARKFKYHLEERKVNGDPLYHDGKEVTVPVIG